MKSDVILAYAGKPINTVDDLRAHFGHYAPELPSRSLFGEMALEKKVEGQFSAIGRYWWEPDHLNTSLRIISLPGGSCVAFGPKNGGAEGKADEISAGRLAALFANTA